MAQCEEVQKLFAISARYNGPNSGRVSADDDMTEEKIHEAILGKEYTEEEASTRKGDNTRLKRWYIHCQEKAFMDLHPYLATRVATYLKVDSNSRQLQFQNSLSCLSQEFGSSITRSLVCQFVERKTLLRYAVQATNLRNHHPHQFKRCQPRQTPFYQLVNRFRQVSVSPEVICCSASMACPWKSHSSVCWHKTALDAAHYAIISPLTVSPSDCLALEEVRIV
ncbi:TPA: hypothetical protein ACH3X1_009739 [Trebouxia sp. C0004]